MASSRARRSIGSRSRGSLGRSPCTRSWRRGRAGSKGRDDRSSVLQDLSRSGRTATMVTVWTIGHGTRRIGEFPDLLESAGIEHLVDVRTAPGSRRNPQFGQEALSAALERSGIAYSWENALGGVREGRPDSPHTPLRNAGFRGYADHMESAGVRGAP